MSEGRTGSRWFKVLAYSVVAAIVLGLSVVVGGALFLPLDGFVVKVTNNENYPLRKVRFSKLGKEGEVGLLRPGESKKIVVSKESFRKGAQLRWLNSSGVDVSTGRMWETFSEVKERIYLVSLKSGSVSSGAQELTFVEEPKSRW